MTRTFRDVLPDVNETSSFDIGDMVCKSWIYLFPIFMKNNTPYRERANLDESLNVFLFPSPRMAMSF
jgi:hypothetical protein